MITRKMLALELLAYLNRGPSFSAEHLAKENTPYSPAEASRQYEKWAKPAKFIMNQLIPELKEKSDQTAS